MANFVRLPNENLASDTTEESLDDSALYGTKRNNFIARFRSYWTDRTARGLHSVSGETKHSDEQNRRDSVGNQRETSGQDSDGQVSGYRRKPNKNNCPCEPFNETLKLIEELF